MSYSLAESLKLHGKNAIAVAESVREAPVGFNGHHSPDTTEWVACHQRCKEIACKAQGYEVMVTDRSIIDSFCYHIANGLPLEGSLSPAFEYAMRHFATNYDRIIFIRCGATEIVKDGVRAEDQGFREKVDAIFEKVIKDSGVDPKRVAMVNFSDLLTGKKAVIDTETLEITVQ